MVWEGIAVSGEQLLRCDIDPLILAEAKSNLIILVKYLMFKHSWGNL